MNIEKEIEKKPGNDTSSRGRVLFSSSSVKAKRLSVRSVVKWVDRIQFVVPDSDREEEKIRFGRERWIPKKGPRSLSSPE